MQEIYECLNKKQNVEQITTNTNTNTWFLLDRVRGEKTLLSFYQEKKGELISQVEALLIGTKHDILLEVSPLLIKLNPVTIPDKLHQMIKEERSGIFIQSSQPMVMPHLQYLFDMYNEENTKLYVRFYDPICWIALNISLSEQQAQLWGNLDKVYTVASSNSIQTVSYHVWEKQSDTLATKIDQTIKLPADFDEISKDVQLLYFFQEKIYQINPELSHAQISKALLNLKILNAKGIDRIDQLQYFINPCLERDSFALQSDVQAILNQDILAYEKVAQLEQLV